MRKRTMGLPTKSYYNIFEAASWWERPMSQIIGWAAAGRLPLVVGISFAMSDDQPIAGMAEISGQDIYPRFTPAAPAIQSFRIFRVRMLEDGEGAPWRFITDMEGQRGIPITTNDISITAEDFFKFQEENGLAQVREKIVYRGGTADKHDWEAMYRQLCKRIFEQGLPEHLRALTREMQEWFIERSDDGEAPDESTIRKRLQPIWNELRGMA